MLAVYARVSSEGQRDDKTIDQQIELGLDWAKSIDKDETPEVYKDDGITGREDDLANRPDMMRLLSDCKEGKVKAVWMYDSTRLARNELAAAIIKRAIVEAKVQLYMGGKLFDFNNPQDKFLFGILSNVGVLDKDMLIARLRRGRNKIIDQGNKGCRAFYGYKQDGKDEETGRIKWKADEAELMEMKKAFDYYLKRKSLMALARHLDPTVTRQDALHATQTWSVRMSHLEYTGMMLDTKGNLIKCKTFPRQIISLEDWQTVQGLLKAGSEKSRSHDNDYISTGLIRCGECGKKYYYRASKGYPYYSHDNTVFGNERRIDCKQYPRGVNKESIDALFAFLYEYQFKNKRDLDRIKSELSRKVDDESGKVDYEVSLCENKLTEVEKKIANIVKAISSGLDAEDFVDSMKALKIEKAVWEGKRDNKMATAHAYKKTLDEIVTDYTKDKIKAWRDMPSRNKKQELAEYFEATIKGTTLTVRTKKTNRYFVFSIQSLSVDAIVGWSRKSPATIERLYEVRQIKPNVFDLVEYATDVRMQSMIAYAENEHAIGKGLVSPRIFDFRKVTS